MPADLQRGPITRALASGAASRSQRPGRSLLAVPVIHDGRVLGALAVVRPAPFGAGEQDLVGRLAPLVAGALHAAAAHEQGAELAYVDALTSVGNRRRFERDLDALARDEQSLVVAMVDVDHFKAFNDRHGHPCGDEALRLVADTLRSCVRRRDLVYRYGGEEFSILLPGATADEAAAVAERIRSSLAEAVPPCGDGAACRLTVSIGVATSTADPRTAVGRADEALFAAKRAGRDRVIVAEP
jgi:diguanylate cyclase (GGDEF)-like protein